MSEVIKRDKQLRLLAQLHSRIDRERDEATPAMVKVWSKQSADDWHIFREYQEAVIDRAGASEIEEQHTVYDDAYEHFYKISMMLEELQTQPIIDEGSAQEQMRTRYTVSARRLANMCERITVETVATMQVNEIDIERKKIDNAFIMLQELAMERIAVGADQDAVLLEEEQSTIIHREALLLLTNGRVQRNAVADENGAAYADALKVPQLQITPFDGRFENWESFRESFEHGVHARQNMAAVQKLQYLKSVLRGEPEELIQNFGLTNDD